MAEIGMDIGIAFQIKDDLFDYGLADIGKPKRNDIKERKVNLPLIHALNHASATEKLHIRRLMKKRNKSSTDIDRIVSFVYEKNRLALAEEKIKEYTGREISLLRTHPAQNE